MSEADAVNGTPADTDADGLDLPDPEDYDEGQLDEEALNLLKELDESQQDVKRMLEAQRAQAQELGSMKEHLCAELQQLKDEAWRFHMGVELEMLKRQLAVLGDLDADLDNMEARLNSEDDPNEDVFQKLLADARAETRSMLEHLGVPDGSQLFNDGDAEASKPAGGEGEGEGEVKGAGEGGSAAGGGEVDGEVDESLELSKMQDRLDEELQQMMDQLQTIKAESAMVAARKAALEEELRKLMAEDLSDRMEDMALDSEEPRPVDGAERATATEGDSTGGATAAEALP